MSRTWLIGSIAAAFCGGALVANAIRAEPAPSPTPNRVFQLRTYTVRDGQMDAVQERFRKYGVDFFKKHRIAVIGFWTPRDEKDGKGKKVVYMIAWPSIEASRAAWKSFGGDTERRKIWAEYNKDGDIVDHWEAVYLDPLEFSPLK